MWSWAGWSAGALVTGHDLGEYGCVTCLARRDDERERAATTVGDKVNLGGQAAAGPSEGMVIRLAVRAPF